MYNMELGTNIHGAWVIIEGNKIQFENEKIAIEFMITVLKDTGRIGY